MQEQFSYYHSIGEQTLADLIISKPIVGQMLCAAVGLIPNCASSVVITELFLQNIITSGAMMSGVLVGAGVGILILFRTNSNIKENIKITATLYVIGVLLGILLDLFNFGALFK